LITAERETGAGETLLLCTGTALSRELSLERRRLREEGTGQTAGGVHGRRSAAARAAAEIYSRVLVVLRNA